MSHFCAIFFALIILIVALNEIFPKDQYNDHW